MTTGLALIGPATPFTCLPQAELTPSGLLLLDHADQEVELIPLVGPLELRYEGNLAEFVGPPPNGRGEWQQRHGSLNLTVTTHRLVWFDDDTSSKKRMARFIHLSNVHQIQLTGGPTLLHPNASKKIIVSTYTYGGFIIAFANKSMTTTTSSTTNNTTMTTRLTSSGVDRDGVATTIQKALDRKAWEMAVRQQAQDRATHSMVQRRVGVDHILTKQSLKQKQVQKVTDQALSGDAEQLLQDASALLTIIQKSVTLLQKHQKTQQQDEDDEDTEAEKLRFLLQDMGMTSALTKEQFRPSGGGGSGAASSDRHYYETLARQVVDFLLPKMNTQIIPGNMISLTDVYCLFNRARGTNLISPEDLRAACNCCSDLQLGMIPRTFASGIVVLEVVVATNASSSPSTNDRLLQACPLTAMEASHILHVSPLLALEQLEEAERQGLLCRDVTLETVRFYPNRFDDWYNKTWVQ